MEGRDVMRDACLRLCTCLGGGGRAGRAGQRGVAARALPARRRRGAAPGLFLPTPPSPPPPAPPAPAPALPSPAAAAPLCGILRSPGQAGPPRPCRRIRPPLQPPHAPGGCIAGGSIGGAGLGVRRAMVVRALFERRGARPASTATAAEGVSWAVGLVVTAQNAGPASPLDPPPLLLRRPPNEGPGRPIQLAWRGVGGGPDPGPRGRCCPGWRTCTGRPSSTGASSPPRSPPHAHARAAAAGAGGEGVLIRAAARPRQGRGRAAGPSRDPAARPRPPRAAGARERGFEGTLAALLGRQFAAASVAPQIRVRCPAGPAETETGPRSPPPRENRRALCTAICA